MLGGEQLPGAAEAGLHLVEAEERAVAAAELLRAGEVAVGGQDHALAEDRLDDEHRDVLAAQLGLERVEVVERHAGDPREVRAEAVGERRLAVDRQRAERQPVEGVLDADDALPLRRRAAELDRRLDRLGAAVREQRLPDRRGRAADELLGEQRRHRRHAHLRRVRGLDLHRLGEPVADARVVPPDVEHPEAAEPVEIAVAARVVEIGALGARPVAVEPDRPQHADHLRVHVLGVQVERLAGARLEQVVQLAHRPKSR